MNVDKVPFVLLTNREESYYFSDFHKGIIKCKS